MANLILRPDLERTIYKRKCWFPTGSYPTWGEIERTMFGAANLFVKHEQSQGLEYLPGSMRLFINFDEFQRLNYMIKPGVIRVHKTGGPRPVIKAKSVPQFRRGPRPQRGQHERGNLDRSTGYLVDLDPLALADEWEYGIAGLFVRPAIVTEVLEDDLPAIIARRKGRHGH